MSLYSQMFAFCIEIMYEFYLKGNFLRENLKCLYEFLFFYNK